MWCLASCRLRAEALVRQLWGPLLPPAAVVQSQPSRRPLDFSLVNGRCYVMFTSDDDDGQSASSPNVLVGEQRDEAILPRAESPPKETYDRRQSDSGVASSECEGPPYDQDASLADELRSRLRDYQRSQTEPVAETPDPGGRPRLSLVPGDTPRLTRSTSLKSGKTPPGTPCRKKIVRFADALGLDLEAVRQFADDDAFTVPASAFSDLQGALPETRSVWDQPASLLTLNLTRPEPQFTLCPQFPPPAADCHFLDRVRTQRVSLESVAIEGTTMRGVVRVLNVAFHKTVTVRYTTNEWATCENRGAIYMAGSCDGFSDKFAFSMDFANLSLGQRVLFAVRYSVNDQDFWDNNRGQNYVLRCQVDASKTAPDSRWLHHFL